MRFGTSHAIPESEKGQMSPQLQEQQGCIQLFCQGRSAMSVFTAWKPFEQMWRDMNRFEKDANRLLGQFLGNGRHFPRVAPAYPALNIWEDADTIYAEAELPGLKLEDLEIYV